MARFGRFGCSRYLVLLAVVVACGPGAVRGAIIAVSNVSQLNDAVAAAVAGDQIVLASGVYTLSQQLKFLAPNVTIRGATGERDDVIIRGQGMNTDSGPRNGLVLMAAGIQVRDLSIRDFYKDGIKILDEYNPDNLVISNVHTSNLGEHHIKAVRESPTGTQTSDNVLIENLLADQTIARTMRPGGPEGLANFIGGIDVTAGNNWTIRKCIMKDIVGVTAGSIGAISLWGGSNNATIEDNWLIRNGMGLVMGISARSPGPSSPWHTEGGIIRNNFIVRGDGDAAVTLFETRDLEFDYNTVYSDEGDFADTVVIGDAAGAPTTNLLLKYNLVRGGLANQTIGGGYTLTGNLIDDTGATVVPAWFVDPVTGDLHLTSLALGAIDQGVLLSLVPDDIDLQTRPINAAPDLGADESPYVVPEPAAAALICMGAAGLILRRKRP